MGDHTKAPLPLSFLQPTVVHQELLVLVESVQEVQAMQKWEAPMMQAREALLTQA
jgi:hypothetical protein